MTVPHSKFLHSRKGIPSKYLPTSLHPIIIIITVVIVIITFFVDLSSARAYVRLEYNHRKHQTEGPDLDPARYLQKFGYLPGSDFETGALRTEEEFSRAIRELQRFANIPVTGKMDPTTVSMMNRSRCGNRDFLESQGHAMKEVPLPMVGSLAAPGTSPNDPQHYFLGPSKWQKKWLSFRLLNYTPDLTRDSTRDAIIRAFHVWAKVIPMTFHEVDSGYADIYIQFSPGYHQDGYPFDGKGGTLAHAFFPGEERGGDVHFDEDEFWTVYSDKGTNLFIVATHELGHSLGLAHSNVQGSIMYPWHQGYKANFDLHYDDILAIQALYGPKAHHGGHTTTTTTTTTTVKPVVTQNPTTKTTPKITTTTTTTSTTQKPPMSESTTTKPPTSKFAHHTHKPQLDDDCDTYIDAISIIRGELFLFKGDKFWRINKSGVSKLPTVTTSFWKGVPKHVEKIDAVYERPSDHRIVFFSGKLYWELHGTYLAHNFPPTGRSITDFGLPYDLKGIDAAFVWGHNKKVYVISGDMYWRLNDSTRMVDYGYPRDMSMWEGVKLPVDAAFTNKEGVTYFFHGPHFWEFNDARMKVRHEHRPGHIGQHWLNCTPGNTNPVPGQDKFVGEADDKGVVSSSSDWRGADALLLLSLMNLAFLLRPA